ncbi:type 1 glutamine amidotransferase [Hoyosella rhizosphaerae]|uniref:Protease n=1 Tax=Hoyosella rhizosphaerae TaxID=1755582 RepID=A0A916UGL7_9ACTN|nr:type 1 glutamine amidotransferase domain-containing protein [Hoyosella rhizosphaerae]MBN4927981.1 type 1 glutamine amidotransferase [Hoyosella rhizosphaerae]GGC71415.1 protease [Hoyosella rhizosphaerae]
MAERSKIEVLVMASPYGAEQHELTQPIAFLTEQGASVTVATIDGADAETLVSDKSPGHTVKSDARISEVDPSSFDLLVLPGGTINADTLRVDESAQAIVTAFAKAGKPIGAICHAPWLLVDTDLARGRRLTSYHTLRRDLENAGSQWVDEAVVIDTSAGFTTITSRSPADLDDFTAALWSAVQ